MSIKYREIEVPSKTNNPKWDPQENTTMCHTYILSHIQNKINNNKLYHMSSESHYTTECWGPQENKKQGLKIRLYYT